MDRPHELTIAAGIIRRPSPALDREEPTSSEFRAPELNFRYGHGSTAIAAAAAWILGVDESRERERSSIAVRAFPDLRNGQQ